MEMGRNRLSFAESFKRIKQEFDGCITGIDGEPYMPPTIPNFDDKKLGIGFFRASFKDSRLDNLTLSRTYFGRSEFKNISFINTDLSESRMCWNDWIECDFTECNLTGCDLRNSIFRDCIFSYAQLENADLRHTTSKNCKFTGTSMKGTKITKPRGLFKVFGSLKLDKKQSSEIDWQEEDGPETSGG